MMIKAFILMTLSLGFNALGNSPTEYEEVPEYNFEWEDCNTDYDQICEAIDYEKPSPLMVWLNSVGGSIYFGLCSVKDYIMAKLTALQKALFLKRVKAQLKRAAHEK